MKPISVHSLATLVVLALPLSAQGSILPYLPKDTMMAVSAPDLSMSMAEFANMPLAKMWHEEEVQTFVADIKEMVLAKIEEGMQQAKEMHAQGALPFDPEQLKQLRVNGGTFAITSLDMAMGDFGPMPRMGFVLHLDFGDSAPTWTKLIHMGLGMLEAEARDEMAKEESMIGDVKLIKLAPTGPEGLEMALNVAMVPNGVLIGTLTDDVRGIVENMQGQTPVLAANENYQAATRRLNTDGAECEVYMAPDPMVDFAMNVLRMAASESRQLAMVDMDGVERALQAMGLRDIGTMGMTTSYVDGKSVTKSYHSYGAKAPKTAATKTIDTSFLKWVPKDAVAFGASTLDVASIYDTLLKGLQAYDADFAQKTLAKLAELEAKLGFTIRGDLFGSLGDHYISWSMPMGTISSAPEMAFLVKVENQENLVRALTNLAAMTNGMVEIEAGEKRGVTAYQVHVNFDPTQGMGGINPFDMFQPTFSFKNGYMVVGFSASDVKRVFQRMDRDDDPKGDIRGNKEFAAVASTIPDGVTSLDFTDWKAQFESLYQLGTGVLAFLPIPEDVPVDMSLLPDSATLTQHLYASVGYSKCDAAGCETVDVSPFGPETWLGLAVLVGAGAATVGMMGARRGF